MTPGAFHFQRFRLNPADRQLQRDGAPIDLNSRYLDALTLLVSENGKLVSKDRFLEEVWRGTPVTDEALTQCIRTLRRQLGDSASSPRFIETVPKHGYRFIAAVEWVEPGAAPSEAEISSPAETQTSAQFQPVLLIGAAGAAGGAIAGAIGGLLYGFAAASQPSGAGMGAISVLLVLTIVTLLIAAIGAAGVSFGIAASSLAQRKPWLWTILGGAVGGLLVGAVVKLLGTDAFSLIFGQSPGEITGAPEGAILGGFVGLGAWVATILNRQSHFWRGVCAAGACGAIAGVVVSLLGGRLMGGSLDLLAQSFPDSRLSLAQIGALFGEDGLGPASRLVTSILEGALFAACIVGAIHFAQRKFPETR